MNSPDRLNDSFGSRNLHRFLLLFLALILGACAEDPAPKPVPPLDPSKAIKKDEPEEIKETATPSAPKQGSVTRMPLGDLYQLVQSNAALIFDVRPSLIYKLGHIPNAISWPQGKFLADIDKHEPRITAANEENTPVVIYCTDMACPDAMNVATRLAQRGHKVSLLQGGYEAWKIATN
ncbi:rhodanese-like domain-containing protein [Luteolibacter sp. AS25]|uniref:rhodanese-like domain-containing protein n=1 Tax=Luteolibacter sp. AS25 TaxID=3135776 RepID=UPI00398B4479